MMIHIKASMAFKKGMKSDTPFSWLSRCVLATVLFVLVSMTCFVASANASTAGGSISRDEILQRAKYWVDRGVPYSQTSYYIDSDGCKKYRTDCSGFVSMAWHLAAQPSTREIAQYATKLSSYDQLLPGDILNVYNVHVVLFVAWTDSSRTAMICYEEDGTKAVSKIRTVASMKSQSYQPLRYTKVTEAAPVVPANPLGGFLDVYNLNTISGWVWNSQKPNTPIQAHINIYNSSGTCIYGVALNANIYREDLVKNGKGNGSHGYSTNNIPWGTFAPDNYTVWVIAVDGSSTNVIKKVDISTKATGFVDSISSAGVKGWVYSPLDPNKVIAAHVYVYHQANGWSFGPYGANAGTFRQDLINLGYGNGNHGYTVPVPWGDLPSGNYTVKTYAVDGSGIHPLINERTYQVLQSTGFVDKIGSDGVTGWVWKPDKPNTPIDAHVYVVNKDNGKSYGPYVASANIFRQDLLNAGKGNGSHGYKITIPWGSIPSGNYDVKTYAVDGTNDHPCINISPYTK